MEWLETTMQGWNWEPPFAQGGKRQARRQQAPERRYALNGSGAHTTR